MEYLGLPFYLNKKSIRCGRLKQNTMLNFYMKNIDKHYSSDINFHTNIFLKIKKNAKQIKNNDKIIFKLLMDKILKIAI
jgi:hypothetical protein